MIKKLTLLAMAVGALVAFSVPAVASANVVLTNSKEEALETGATISAFGSNVKTSAPGGNEIFCNEITLGGEVGVNGPEEVGIDITSTSAKYNESGTCVTSNPNVFATITQIKIDNLMLDTGGVGSADLTFEYDLKLANGTVIATCHLEGTVNLSYVTNSDVITVNPSKLLPGTPSSELCAPEGTIGGDLTLTDAENEPVTIS